MLNLQDKGFMKYHIFAQPSCFSHPFADSMCYCVKVPVYCIRNAWSQDRTVTGIGASIAGRLREQPRGTWLGALVPIFKAVAILTKHCHISVKLI